jgi:hypothetical protein
MTNKLNSSLIVNEISSQEGQTLNEKPTSF